MAESLLDLSELLPSWLITLRGERKSPSTVKAYRSGVQAFIDYCAAQGIPADLTKANVVSFMAYLSDREPATARLRLTAVKLFARWLADEEGFNADPIQAVRAPKLDQRVVAHLTENEVRALLRACDGGELRDKRDKALVSLFVETGMRAEEMLALTVGDVSIADCSVTVVRGKGAKGRKSKFSAQTAAALDRYMRARRKEGHPAQEGPLWLSSRGALSYSGLQHALGARAEAAGVPNFHLHRLRHSAAVRWLRAGGSESGLMAQAGWQSRHMVDRYIKSANEELAADEFDRLNLAVEP
ncbi:tyrosine-type recombinase/integrase [Mycolicibacterium palauense]|uniref:tyrosine-type recombinase/integrase n=1 Tax=Mycolicibacterium palauense TaxID=2034511 RepID=UPI000BFEC81F|nr:tyrosine-type recombinase/integrase [Mycolicibacterium palauense]